jgi:hypothetical protein
MDLWPENALGKATVRPGDHVLPTKAHEACSVALGAAERAELAGESARAAAIAGLAARVFDILVL